MKYINHSECGLIKGKHYAVYTVGVSKKMNPAVYFGQCVSEYITLKPPNYDPVSENRVDLRYVYMLTYGEFSEHQIVGNFAFLDSDVVYEVTDDEVYKYITLNTL